MTQPGGRDSGGNSSIVATATQVGGPAIVATGGPTSGSAVLATGTGSGAGITATGGATGIGVNAVGTGAAAVVATNAASLEALKVFGDTASTTAVKATLFVSPLQNEPSGVHAIGHMYVNAAGVLYICTVAGTPGTWTKVGAQ